MDDIVETLRRIAVKIANNGSGGWAETCGKAADEIERLRTEHDEILQAHTALVARLHDVTTMLEAERARIAGAPVGTARFDAHEWLTLDDADLDESCDGQRFALVKLDK
jgi:hypothetical protein